MHAANKAPARIRRLNSPGSGCTSPCGPNQSREAIHMVAAASSQANGRIREESFTRPSNSAASIPIANQEIYDGGQIDRKSVVQDKVRGVQTCALPIYKAPARIRRFNSPGWICTSPCGPNQSREAIHMVAAASSQANGRIREEIFTRPSNSAASIPIANQEIYDGGQI